MAKTPGNSQVLAGRGFIVPVFNTIISLPTREADTFLVNGTALAIFHPFFARGSLDGLISFKLHIT
jgi:hypothetical protein